MVTDTLERPAAADALLTIDRDILFGAIRAISQVVEARNTIPILSNLLFDTKGERLRIAGTDLDILFEVQIECDCAGVEPFTVEASRLTAAVDTLRPGAIVFERENGWVTLKQKASRRKLPIIPAEDFPTSALGTISTTFAMDASELLWIFNSVQSSISTEAARYYLCGIFFDVEGGDLVAAATDGNRMIQARKPCPVGAEGMAGFTLPTKAVRLLRSLLDNAEDGQQVEINVTDRKFEIRQGSFRLDSKLIDGAYPDYRRVIPWGNDKRLKVHSAEMIRGLRAAAAAVDGRARGVRINMSKSECMISGFNADGSRSIEPLEADYDSDEFQIGINAQYAQQTVAAFGEAAQMEIDMLDATGAILLRSPDRPGLLAVIMPMRA